jgi:hypothetical protein
MASLTRRRSTHSANCWHVYYGDVPVGSIAHHIELPEETPPLVALRLLPGFASDAQAEPTIGKAINGGYDLLEAKCNKCDRVSLVPQRAMRQPKEMPIWGLGCERPTRSCVSAVLSRRAIAMPQFAAHPSSIRAAAQPNMAPASSSRSITAGFGRTRAPPPSLALASAWLSAATRRRHRRPALRCPSVAGRGPCARHSE